MNPKIALVILAAGMGSRYGGLKQIDGVGSHGESIIDFSIYDAIEAGFDKLYLIIRKEHEALFEEHLVAKLRGKIEVEYVYQTLDDLPEGYSLQVAREKPLGTTHALFAARHQVHEAFMICNADDYYGKQAFKDMAVDLRKTIKDYDFSMVGFQLNNTLTDNGSVTRGVCLEVDGTLSEIQEIKQIKRTSPDTVVYEQDGQWLPIAADRLVSMNFWGFTPAIFPLVTEAMREFLDHDLGKDPLKAECLLPMSVGAFITRQQAKVRILPSYDRWFGVTYKEDRQSVVDAFAQFKEAGLYPDELWK